MTSTTKIPSYSFLDKFYKKLDGNENNGKTGWDLYKEFEHEFSPSAVVSLFHQKLKNLTSPKYSYIKLDNKKFISKLSYETEEWESEFPRDKKKEAKNDVAKVALNFLTDENKNLAISIRRILEMRCKLGPKRLVFGDGVHQMAKNIDKKASRPPSDIWFETQQPSTPYRILLFDFMLKYHLGNPIYVDIKPPSSLPPPPPRNINDSDNATISIAKAIANAATGLPPVHAISHSSISTIIDTPHTPEKKLFYVALIIGKRKFNPSKGFEIRPEAQDHIAGIALEILHKEIRSNEIEKIYKNSMDYQKSIGRIPDNDDIFNYDIPSFKNWTNGLGLPVEGLVSDEDLMIIDLEGELDAAKLEVRKSTEIYPKGSSLVKGKGSWIVNRNMPPSVNASDYSRNEKGSTDHRNASTSLVKVSSLLNCDNVSSSMKGKGPAYYGAAPPSSVNASSSLVYGGRSSLFKGRLSDHGSHSYLVKGRKSPDHGNQATVDHESQSFLVKEGRLSDHEKRSSIMKEGELSDHGSQSTLDDGNQSSLDDGNQSTLDGNQSTLDGNQSSLDDENQSTLVGNQSSLGDGNQSNLDSGNQSTLDDGSQSNLVKSSDHGGRSSVTKEGRPSDYRNQSSFANERRPSNYNNRSRLMNKRHLDRRNQSTLVKEKITLDHLDQSSLKRKSDCGNQINSVKKTRLLDYVTSRNNDYRNNDHGRYNDYDRYNDRGRHNNDGYNRNGGNRPGYCYRRFYRPEELSSSCKTFVELVNEFALKTHILKPRYQIYEIEGEHKFYSKMFLNGVEYTGEIRPNEMLAKESVSLIGYESIVPRKN